MTEGCMTENRCRWVGTNEPRVLPNRHHDGCEDDTCRGCQACPMDHCRVCGIEHATGACPGCVGEVRDNLGEIRRMCVDLVIEVQHRGVESEAMVLLGPTVDVEAREHWEASVLAGRILPPECEARDLEDVRHWLETADDERHPLLVLGTWAMRYRDAFEHEEPLNRANVFSEADYLERNLTEAGDEEWTPFDQFAHDVRSCVAHMERVLHDGEQVDEGVDCLTCARPLTRVWGFGIKVDGWECKRCREFSTEAQYRFAVTQDYIKNADWLPAEYAEVRTLVKASTVRSWAREQPDDAPPLVRKTLHGGRTVYSVADVERVRDEKGLAPCA